MLSQYSGNKDKRLLVEAEELLQDSKAKMEYLRMKILKTSTVSSYPSATRDLTIFSVLNTIFLLLFTVSLSLSQFYTLPLYTVAYFAISHVYLLPCLGLGLGQIFGTYFNMKVLTNKNLQYIPTC